MTAKSLSDRIQGSAAVRIVQEFATNSGLFPLFNAIRVLTTGGPQALVADPANHAMLIAGVVQAYFLGRRTGHVWWQRALLNLLAPALYSVVDLVIEGPAEFMAAPYHGVYWVYAVMMAALYMVQAFVPRAKVVLAILINMLRTLLFPVIYVLSEYGHEFSGTPGLAGFFTYWNSSSGHTFILLAALLFGLLLGLAESQIDRYTDFLRRVASRLKEVSEWALESSLLEESVDDSTVLNQRRTERAVLFLDIRGFTAWSESRDPETVIGMLNQFYEIAESTITEGGGHKPHFIGDEVMTWFDNPHASVEVARRLCREVNQRLRPYGLASGGGLHLGDVVEGLMGSSGTRGYNIIGDTVNTTARLCAAAQPGEVLISQALANRTALMAELKEPREIRAKGKQETLTVYPLH